MGLHGIPDLSNFQKPSWEYFSDFIFYNNNNNNDENFIAFFQIIYTVINLTN